MPTPRPETPQASPPEEIPELAQDVVKALRRLSQGCRRELLADRRHERGT